MVPPAYASRQENYHHPRMPMTAVEAIGRLRASGQSDTLPATIADESELENAPE